MEKVIVTPELITEAKRILEKSDTSDIREDIHLSVTKNLTVVLSSNPNDLIPLHEIKHNNISYYLGLPKQ